jgi:hypothetical protein
MKDGGGYNIDHQQFYYEELQQHYYEEEYYGTKAKADKYY